MNISTRMISLTMAYLAAALVSGHRALDGILPQANQDECREESNFRGELNDDVGRNVTQELKCFAACSLMKLGIMNEKDGTVNMTRLDELIASHTPGKDAADVFKTTVVEPCMKEVKKSTDYCEYSYQLIACGMSKVP
uniref:Odorant binding protein 13 n=1 Tax=Adelphocoris lineolatus TaxID=236346 RepID=F4Y5Q1_ADELI|nr:odorant binding protein 13 [Adelphocoris lineolatus]